MSGHGQFVCENGDVYEGEFRDLKRHGFGFQKWSTGQQFRGFWKDDRYVSGVYRDERGRVFRGDFKRGRVERIYGKPPAEMSFSQSPISMLPSVDELRADQNTEHKPRTAQPTTARRRKQSIAEAAVEEMRPQSSGFRIVRRARRFANPPPTSPGPAAYTPRQRSTAPRPSMGLKKKCYFDEKLRESITPGPKYTLGSTLRAHTAADIRPRTTLPESFHTPGPGSHATDQLSSGAKAALGNGPKFRFSKSVNHQLPYESGKGQYFSSEFTKCNTSWNSPGPCQYRIASSFEKMNKVSIRGRVKPLDGPTMKDSKPGPGSHDLLRVSPRVRAPAYGFGGERQRKEFHNPNIISPGPIYNTRLNVCTNPRNVAELTFTK